MLSFQLLSIELVLEFRFKLLRYILKVPPVIQTLEPKVGHCSCCSTTGIWWGLFSFAWPWSRSGGRRSWGKHTSCSCKRKRSPQHTDPFVKERRIPENSIQPSNIIARAQGWYPLHRLAAWTRGVGLRFLGWFIKSLDWGARLFFLICTEPTINKKQVFLNARFDNIMFFPC